MEFCALKGLLPNEIYFRLSESGELTEIRIRKNKPLAYLSADGSMKKLPYVATAKDIESIVAVASEFSLYSVEEQLAGGYLSYKGGVRIGVAGEGVSRGAELVTVKDVSSLCLRIPHEVLGCAEKLYEAHFSAGIPNTLIISRAGRGKTTLIRDLARLVSERANTVIVDERHELAGKDRELKLGDFADVISGAPKAAVYENVIRALNPSAIVFDELFWDKEIETVSDVARSGVAVIASVHAESVAALESSRRFSPLLHCMDLAVTLSSKGRVGTVESIKCLR